VTGVTGKRQTGGLPGRGRERIGCMLLALSLIFLALFVLRVVFAEPQSAPVG
jgi:hypothetical protein